MKYDPQFIDFLKMLKTDTWCILDLETTGLNDNDEAVQIAILSADDKILFDQYVKPNKEMSIGATRTNGITTAQASTFKPITEYIDELKTVLEKYPNIITYNAAFDSSKLYQSLKAHNLETKWMEQLSFWCIMVMANHFFSVKLNKPNMKFDNLSNACKRIGFEYSPVHNAIADSKATLVLARHFAKFNID